MENAEENKVRKTTEEGGLHFLEQMNQEQIRHDMMEEGKKDRQRKLKAFFHRLFRRS